MHFNPKNALLDAVHSMPEEYEKGTKFLHLGVAFTRYRHEKM